VPRLVLVAAILVGAALRLAALRAPYVHPDEEVVPLQALSILASDTWRPPDLVYPSGFLYLLRAGDALDLAWRVHGGTARDAIDLLAAYLADPFAFLLVGRTWACAFGIATVVLAGWLGAGVGDAWTGAIAALLFAVSPLHVRDSHYGTGDVPAAAFVTAALAASVAYVSTARRRTLALAAVAAGLAAGFRYPAGLALIAVVAAAIVAAARTPGERLGRVALSLVAGVLAFTAVSPFTLLDASRGWARLAQQLRLSNFAFGPQGLSLATLLTAASGTVVCGLALVGAVLLAASRPRAAVPLLAFALPALLILGRTGRVFARYTLPLLPIAAVLAAVAIRSIASRGPRRLGTLTATALLVAALADPAARARDIVRALGREDTRLAAGTFLTNSFAPGDYVWLPVLRTSYAVPMLPLTPGAIAWRLEREVAAALNERSPATGIARWVVRYKENDARSLARMAHVGGLVVTLTHPDPRVQQWASTDPTTVTFLRQHATLLVTFTGMPDDVPPEEVLFEPIDANFVPLRGAGRLVAPGPTITIWRISRS
jgi:hypothetical protein